MQDIAKKFNEDGFVKIDGAIPQPLMLELAEAVQTIFLAHAKPGEDIHQLCLRLNKEDQGLLFRLYQTIAKSTVMDAVRLACVPYIKAILKPGVIVDLGGGLLMGIPHDNRIVYDWHQEIVYHRELENVTHLWLPVLLPADMSNGTMSALRGSHKLGIIPYDKKPKTVSNSTTNLIPRGVDEMKKKHEEVFFVAKPGDLVMLHSFVVHRSNLNSGTKTRFIASFRVAALEKAPSSYDFSVKD